MPCASCHWWRPDDRTPKTAEGVPHYGRCVARPPEPKVQTFPPDTESIPELIVLTIWPCTYGSDHCAGFVHRDWIDQDTGMLKRPTVAPPGYDEGDETMQ